MKEKNHTKINCTKRNLLITAIIIGISFYSTFLSCDKMDATYKDFLKEGETIYPGKADSLRVYSGYNRLKISWLLISDPSIVSCKVFWNNYNDSLEVPVTRSPGVDTINIIIENLEERDYTFNVYTYDIDGNKSVVSEVIGSVYGDIFRSSIYPRVIHNVSGEDVELILEWQEAAENSIGDELIYTSITGAKKKVLVPPDQQRVVISDYMSGSNINYYSLFIPDSTAIDVVHSDTVLVNIGISENEISKSDFQLFELPGDYSVPNTAASVVSCIWTNSSMVNSPTYISKVNGHPMPQWFTIDLGREYNLTKIIFFQRGDTGANSKYLYASGNLMEFEVWGTSNPDLEYNPDDHGGDFGDRWILLQSCVINRPSGNVKPTASTRLDNTEEDILAAINGHEFSLANNGKIRYVRIKAIKNWHHTGNAYVNIAAINFWTVGYNMSKDF